MHLELVELLRCPIPHGDSVLVAATAHVESRYIVQGLLGCPVCAAEYPIVDGVTHFGVPAHRAAAAGNVGHEGEEQFMALAAQLGLREGRNTFALVGHSITTANALRDLVAARMLIINPPDLHHANEHIQHAIAVAPIGILSAHTLPLVEDKLDGVAVASGSESLLAHALQALRVRGRLVAPATSAMPNDVRELARDATVFVAEREPKRRRL